MPDFIIQWSVHLLDSLEEHTPLERTQFLDRKYWEYVSCSLLSKDTFLMRTDCLWEGVCLFEPLERVSSDLWLPGIFASECLFLYLLIQNLKLIKDCHTGVTLPKLHSTTYLLAYMLNILFLRKTWANPILFPVNPPFSSLQNVILVHIYNTYGYIGIYMDCKTCSLKNSWLCMLFPFFFSFFFLGGGDGGLTRNPIINFPINEEKR